MHAIYTLLISILITTYLNANPSYNDEEFPYIKPIAVEEIQTAEPVIVLEETFEKDEVIDSDGDGVSDKLDECKDTPSGIKVNEKGCEKDSDEDGVLDSKDQCPDTSKEFTVNEVGCPKTATLHINFEYKSFKIDSIYNEDIIRFAKFLQENVGYQVILYGHTDSDGTEESNDILSKNRADSVKKALIDLGIESIRLTAIGKGELEPVKDNETVENRAENRRVEIELIY